MKKVLLLSVVLIGVLVVSCNPKEVEPSETTEQINLNKQDDLKEITLGKQLENPYSVENMQKAYNNLRSSSARGLGRNIEIKTTHLYLRFKPKNEEELDLLKKDSTLNLYEYPLDYEISEEGDYYHEPEIPEEMPTYQYTAVKADKELPNVPYDLLANLFLPDEDDDSEEDTTASRSFSQSLDVDRLVDEALRITGNLEENSVSSRVSRRRSRWRPSGKITVWDTNKWKYVGIEGIKVRVRRWFTTRRGFTNSEGEFTCNGRFRGKARYRMDWERHHFALRSGFWASAQKRGPRGRGKWNWQIKNKDRHQYYGTIFRAAYHYYYKDIKGLRRPPLNTFWKSQTRIRASRKQDAGKGGSHMGLRRVWGLGDGIYIYTFGKSSSQTYATTIHELAHASHWNFQRINHNVSKLILAESWARGVQWELTRMVYSNYVPQYLTLGYTGFVHDLIDKAGITKSVRLYYNKDEKKIKVRPTGTKTYTDNVTGYTIRQLEDALKGINTFNGWKNQIKSMNPNNPSKDYVDETYNFWNKKYIIGIFVSILLLISCSDKGCGGVLDITDVIINNTDYDMKVKIWGNYHLSSTKGEGLLIINKKSKINRSFEFQNLVMTFSDSSLITFDNKKKLLFKGDSSILKRAEKSNDNCTNYYTYTFTNEDYENAKDCGGACE